MITLVRGLAVSLALLLVSCVFSNVSAGLITEIKGLAINGTLYNVTFHPSYEQAFDELWDADGDLIFGEGDGSRYNSAPTFWGDQSGALAAANALITYFGSDGLNGTFGPSSQCFPGLFCDSFLVPFRISPRYPEYVEVYADESNPDLDVVGIGGITPSRRRTGSFASFAAFQAIPEPASLSLLGFGLVIARWASRKSVRLPSMC